MQNETTEAPSWQQLSDNARNEARQILADRPSISLTRVAALADVSRMTLYRYLEQHHCAPKTSTIDAISHACREIEQVWPVERSGKAIRKARRGA